MFIFKLIFVYTMRLGMTHHFAYGYPTVSESFVEMIIFAYDLLWHFFESH